MNSETSPIPEPENFDKIVFEPASSSDSSQDDRAIAEPNLDPTPETTVRSTESNGTEVSDSADFARMLELAETEAEDIEDNVDGNENLAQGESTELFVDTWLDEKEAEDSELVATDSDNSQLEQQKANLQQEIAELKAEKEQLSAQAQQAQNSMERLIEEGTKELIDRKASLRIEIDKLERRKERINQEMRSNFAGSSKELAIRVQGFKEYLVGSLQDLATAADKLDLARPEAPPARSRHRGRDDSSMESRSSRRNSEARGSRDRESRSSRGGEGRDSRRSTTDLARNRRGENRARGSAARSNSGQFSEPTFADHSRKIRQLLDQYCNSPDYYGSPWQLRRTFDQNQARKVQEWFFSQGGRGAIDSSGSRLQNILVASAVISILHNIHRDRTQVLILTDTPENLGEWRRGLEDCLGISRRDFGANRGVVLFDTPEVLVQRAERLIADKLLPIIIIDEETEELLNLSMLKFPIWLAFASTNKPSSSNYLY